MRIKRPGCCVTTSGIFIGETTMYKLILGNKNYSSWSLRPWLVMKKAKIEFEELVIPLYVDGYQQALAPYSPSGKVPVLISDALTIWDSLAICEYIAEVSPLMWPQDSQSRALARSISHEMHSGFSLIRENMPMNCRAVGRHVSITAPIQQEIDRIQSIWQNCLEENHPGPWLFGDFSIADAMYAPIVSRFNTYGVELNQTCSKYMQHVLNDKHMKQWFSAAAEELHVIELSEVVK